MWSSLTKIDAFTLKVSLIWLRVCLFVCLFFSSIYKTVAATKPISNLSNSYLISEAVYFHRLTAMLLLSQSKDRNNCDHLHFFFIPLTEFPTLSKNTREKRIKKLASSMLQLLKKLTKLTERPFEVGGRLRRFVLRSLWINPELCPGVTGGAPSYGISF